MRQINQMVARKIQLPVQLKESVLAFGSQAKNTLCFARGKQALLSRELADLNDPEDLKKFEAEIKYFLHKKPKVLAYDLHPEYQSSKYANGMSGFGLYPVQHHHAHIASVMAQSGIKKGRVIGVAFDGTGLGDDNSIWGAEFLVCDYKSYRRAAHLRQIPLIGGDSAIREPWRLGAAWLYLAYKDAFWKLRIDFVRSLSKSSWQVLKRMYQAGYNSPLASSMGRLFDAAASLVLVEPNAAFEAELAIKLEKTASGSDVPATSGYKFLLVYRKGAYILDPLPVFRGIVRDLLKGVAKEQIARSFHLTVAQMIVRTCLLLRKRYRINQVVLSGGVFQNKLLLHMSLDLLYKEGFRVYTGGDISCNDSGISLGQAVIAGINNY